MATSHAIKVRDVRFNMKQTQEEVAAIMKKYRPDREMVELPEYELFKNKGGGQWYVYSKCGKCGTPAKQPVSKLVNYNLGCASCLGERTMGKHHAVVAERTIKKGRVPFSREMTPKAVAAIMNEYRPDRKMLGLPIYKCVATTKNGYWYVETECGDCGHIATQKVYSLVNYNCGCNKCKDGRL